MHNEDRHYCIGAGEAGLKREDGGSELKKQVEKRRWVSDLEKKKLEKAPASELEKSD